MWLLVTNLGGFGLNHGKGEMIGVAPGKRNSWLVSDGFPVRGTNTTSKRSHVVVVGPE